MLGIITVGSLLLAMAMTIVAWRVAREEQRRVEARVAALSAEVERDGAGLPLGRVDRPGDRTGAPGLFEREGAAARPSRTAAGIALAVFVLGSGAALAIVVGGPAATPRAGAAAASKEAAPLELVALGHERDGEGLSIHGIVRNPPAGAPVGDLRAVVLLFDRKGRVVSSASAPIESADLSPGIESRFNIMVPEADDIARYRVSFRTERGIVTHVDRRAAETEDAQ